MVFADQTLALKHCWVGARGQEHRPRPIRRAADPITVWLPVCLTPTLHAHVSPTPGQPRTCKSLTSGNCTTMKAQADFQDNEWDSSVASWKSFQGRTSSASCHKHQCPRCGWSDDTSKGRRGHAFGPTSGTHRILCCFPVCSFAEFLLLRILLEGIDMFVTLLGFLN